MIGAPWMILWNHISTFLKESISALFVDILTIFKLTSRITWRQIIHPDIWNLCSVASVKKSVLVEMLWECMLKEPTIKEILLNICLTKKLLLDVDAAIKAKMTKDGRTWYCTECDYFSNHTGHVYEHIESKHVVHSGYVCQYCEKVLKTKASAGRHYKNCRP